MGVMTSNWSSMCSMFTAGTLGAGPASDEAELDLCVDAIVVFAIRTAFKIPLLPPPAMNVSRKSPFVATTSQSQNCRKVYWLPPKNWSAEWNTNRETWPANIEHSTINTWQERMEKTGIPKERGGQRTLNSSQFAHGKKEWKRQEAKTQSE